MSRIAIGFIAGIAAGIALLLSNQTVLDFFLEKFRPSWIEEKEV
jgi:hypothetical protein